MNGIKILIMTLLFIALLLLLISYFEQSDENFSTFGKYMHIIDDRSSGNLALTPLTFNIAQYPLASSVPMEVPMLTLVNGNAQQIYPIDKQGFNEVTYLLSVVRRNQNPQTKSMIPYERYPGSNLVEVPPKIIYIQNPEEYIKNNYTPEKITITFDLTKPSIFVDPVPPEEFNILVERRLKNLRSSYTLTKTYVLGYLGLDHKTGGTELVFRSYGNLRFEGTQLKFDDSFVNFVSNERLYLSSIFMDDCSYNKITRHIGGPDNVIFNYFEKGYYMKNYITRSHADPIRDPNPTSNNFTNVSYKFFMATPSEGEYIKDGDNELNLITEIGLQSFSEFKYVKVILSKKLPYPPGYALFFRRKYTTIDGRTVQFETIMLMDENGTFCKKFKENLINNDQYILFYDYII
jgi:hypothetical protein